MRSLWKRLRTPVLAGLVLTAVAACGGGGGGGTGGGGTTGATTGTTTGGTTGTTTGGTPPPFNGGLVGAIYYTDAVSNIQEFDLAGGVGSSIRPSSGQARPAADGSELAIVQTTPLGDPLDSGGRDELDILTRDGATVARFSQPERLRGAAKLSPDRSKVVVDWDSTANGDPVTTIPTVFDRSGKVLARFSGARDAEWLPDGRLLLAQGDSIRVTDTALSSTTLVRQFANDAPDFLAASADGQRLAFDLGDASQLKNHVWVMNLDGSGLRQVTTSSNNEDGAAWAPDGSALAVRQGINYPAIFAGLPGSGRCPTVYAVPLNASAPIVLDAADPSPAFALQQRSGGTTGGICAYSPLAWRGALPALASRGGTASTGSGPNAGLGGRLLFEEATSFSVLDVAAANTNPVAGKNGTQGSAPYFGYEGTEFSFLKSPPDSGNGDNQQISIANLSGAAVAGFEVPTGLTGPAKLAPGGQKLAVRYASLALGDAGGARIVSVFARDGSGLVRANGYDGWSWLPDGRLAVSGDNRIALTDTALSTLTVIATVPDPVSGLEASPDGSALAFVMDGHVWRIGTDGKNLRQLSVSGGSESLPVWSPDSRFVAARYAGSCPELHAVPADGQRVFVANPAVASTELLLRQNGGSGLRNVCAFSAASWR